MNRTLSLVAALAWTGLAGLLLAYLPAAASPVGQSSPVEPTPTWTWTPSPMPTPTFTWTPVPPTPTWTPEPMPSPTPVLPPTAPVPTPALTFTVEAPPVPTVAPPPPEMPPAVPMVTPTGWPGPITPIPSYVPTLYLPSPEEMWWGPTEVATPWPTPVRVDRSRLVWRFFAPYVRFDWGFYYPFLRPRAVPTPAGPPNREVWRPLLQRLLQVLPGLLCLTGALTLVLLRLLVALVERRPVPRSGR